MKRPMLRLISALAATGLLTGAAFAKCSGTDIIPRLTEAHPATMAVVREAASKVKNTEAILWRVEKDGLAPSHLFGTMHVSDPRITTMPAEADDALKSAKIVALEIADMSPMALMEGVAKVPQLMVYMDGSRLDEKLSGDDFGKVADLITRSGMPGEMAPVIRPWLITIMLSMPECETLRAAAGNQALDQLIGEAAKQRKTPLTGLETVQSQLQSMASVPEGDQLAMLRVSLAFMNEREDMFETLIQAYLGRNLGIVMALTEGMAKIAKLDKSGFANFSRELIVKRNHKMFDASLPLVDGGGAFIAVGAAHLIGDTGLVALYRKAGFTVTAIN